MTNKCFWRLSHCDQGQIRLLNEHKRQVKEKRDIQTHEQLWFCEQLQKQIIAAELSIRPLINIELCISTSYFISACNSLLRTFQIRTQFLYQIIKMRVLAVLAFTLVICSVLADDCPSGTCESTETCCDGPTPGEYGCCPDPNAVCCSDGLHCCPTDTVCNLAAGTCDSSDQMIPFVFRKKPQPIVRERKVAATALQVAEKVEIIYCPGGVYYCPDGSTCCLLSSGQYGCCPYPAAQCCADRVHCCPLGTRCDATSQYCVQGTNKYAALFKRRAFPLV